MDNTRREYKTFQEVIDGVSVHHGEFDQLLQRLRHSIDRLSGGEPTAALGKQGTLETGTMLGAANAAMEMIFDDLRQLNHEIDRFDRVMFIADAPKAVTGGMAYGR